MIPPIDPSVLEDNPDFADVYRTLTEEMLNPDGSTRKDAEEDSRNQVRQQLKEYRLYQTRRRLLRQALTSAAAEHSPSPSISTASKSIKPRSNTITSRRQKSEPKVQLKQSDEREQSQPTSSLPPELVNLLTLLPPVLSHASSLPPASLALLFTTPPISNLPVHLPQLATLVSTSLTRTATSTARAFHPRTNPSYIHRALTRLPDTASQTLSALDERTLYLRAARLAATHALSASYLAPHAQLQSFLVSALERQHGDLAAHTISCAEETSLRARAWREAALAALWSAVSTSYPAEARTALENYRQHLRGAEIRVADGIRVREAELKDYGVDEELEGKPGGSAARDPERKKKEKTMREMARVYREMQTRMREVKGDLQRLRR